MAKNKPLPPLPPSDKASLINNRKARSFWQDAEIIHIKNEPAKQCQHEFVNSTKRRGIKCTKCNFGLLGSKLDVKDGKAYAQGKQIVFPK